MRKIRKIIIHCSATPEGRHHTVEDLRRWHRNGNGWRDIGYHYVIYLDGSIHPGRPESRIGAHCEGHNTDSIGICYIGGVASDGRTPKDTRTPAQRHSMEQLVAQLKARYPEAVVKGHSYYNPSKACPSFDVNFSD